MIEGLNFQCKICKRFKRILNTNNRVGLPSICNECKKKNLVEEGDTFFNSDFVATKEDLRPHKEID